MSIHFNAVLSSVQSIVLVRLPINVSEQLPSRGMVMIHGKMLNAEFDAALEPDGNFSHWFQVSDQLIENLNLSVGDVLDLTIDVSNEWQPPQLPSDVLDALKSSGLIQQWQMLTNKAKWDWLRWFQYTKNPETRKKRIGIACSKLEKGDKRPCCFDRTRCTITTVSKSGVLLDL